MYDLLEDLRIDLGIPSGNENIDNNFGDTFNYGNDKRAESREQESEYSRDAIPNTLTHVTSLGQNTVLNDYREDDLHAFKPITSTSDIGDQSHGVKSNTPVFSEVRTPSRKGSYSEMHETENSGKSSFAAETRTPSRKGSYHSEMHETENSRKSSFAAETRTPSRKGSYHSEMHETENSRKSSFAAEMHQKTINPVESHEHNESFDDRASEVLSDVTAVSSRSSLGKTTMKFDNNTHKPNSYDEESGYDDVDTACKSDIDDQDENKKHDSMNVKEDDYDTRYDDDEYEVETERTENEHNDLSTVRTNYEDIQEGNVTGRSENDVYGQTEIESTTTMKTDTKSDDDRQS